MYIGIIILILLFGLALIDTLYMEQKTEKACNDIGGIDDYSGKLSYCIYPNNIAKEVIYKCKGLLFNKECTAITVIK